MDFFLENACFSTFIFHRTVNGKVYLKAHQFFYAVSTVFLRAAVLL